jgi:chromosome segregation ATPase
MKSKVNFFIYILLFIATIILLYKVVFFKNRLDEVSTHLKEAKQELQKMDVLLSKSRQQIETAMLQLEVTQQEAVHIKTSVESVNEKHYHSKYETAYLLDSLKNNVLAELESMEAIKIELSKFE